MIRTLILLGSITWYAGPYVKRPLRCGSVNGASPIYDTTHTWIAIDIDAYPNWRCADLIRVTVGEDVLPLIPLLDSGPLSRYCIRDGDTCMPIIGDLPRHVWQWGDALSVRGSVENITGGLRLIGALDRWNEVRQEVGQ